MQAHWAAGLAVEDRIELTLEGEQALLAAAETHRDYVAGETLAVGFRIGDDDGCRRLGPGSLREEIRLTGWR